MIIIGFFAIAKLIVKYEKYADSFNLIIELFLF